MSDILEKYHHIDLDDLLHRPQNLDPDAIEYQSDVPLTARQAAVVLYFAEVETATTDYATDITFWRKGIPDGRIDHFTHAVWQPEELQHGTALQRAYEATEIRDGDTADLGWLPVSQATSASRTEHLRLLIKRQAIGAAMRLGHLTPFSDRLTKLVEAFHMTIGAIHERVTGRSYSALKDYLHHPVFDKVITGIKPDENKHEMFYLASAIKLTEEDFVRRVLTTLLPRTFQPVGVGTGYHRLGEFGFVAAELEQTKRAGSLAGDVDDALKELLKTPELTVVTSGVERAKAAFYEIQKQTQAA